MKESTIGTFGVLAVVLLLMVKMAALSTVVEREFWRGLLVAPMMARWSILLLAHISRPAREGGLGMIAIQASTKKTVVVGSATMLIATLLFWPMGLVNLVWIVPLVKLGSSFWNKRIGGVTGDVFGATVEVVEMGVLVVASLFC